MSHALRSGLQVFDDACKPLVEHVLDGYNSCCFAYGQTGSGKTYSIFGEAEDTRRGIVPRAMEQVFVQLAKKTPYTKVSLYVSFVEIYMEKLRDLGLPYLDAQSGGAPAKTGAEASLEIRENPNGATFVQGLSVIPVTTLDEVMAIIGAGVALRATYETSMNEVSSRSHTVFTLHVVQRERNKPDAQTTTGMLNLVDLAGSERLDKSKSEGQRKKEAVVINKSLSALGNVVMALQRSDYSHVPYRDSKLTRLLQDSLGGNSFTTLLATLNPMQENYEECLNTLMFANRCRYVQNSPSVNYVANNESSDKRVKALMTEISELREALSASSKREGGLRELLNNKIKLSTGNETLTRMLGMTPSGEGKPVNPRMSGNAINEIAIDPIRALEVISDKVEKKTAAVKEAKEENRLMQAAHKDEAEKHRGETHLWRGKVKSLEEKIEFQAREQEGLMTAMHDRHAKEMETSAEGTRQLIENLQGQLRDMPSELRANARKILDAEQAAARAKGAADEEWSGRYSMFGNAKDEEIVNLKEKYEFLLESKGQSLRKFVNEYEEYKAASEEIADKLRTEVQLLYEYTEKLTHVMERIECGMYPVRDRGGIKSMLIAPDDKPGKMPIERCAELQRLLSQAGNFIATHEQEGSALGDFGGPEELAGLSLDELRDEVMQLRGRAPDAPHAVAASAGGAPSGAFTFTFALNLLQRSWMTLWLTVLLCCCMFTEESRRRVEEEVLTELASHPTVVYIRGLEDECEGYREALSVNIRPPPPPSPDSACKVFTELTRPASVSHLRFAIAG